VRHFWRIFVHAGGLWLERHAFVHAGSLAYYSSLILFFGAALTKARVLASGKPVVPRPLAIRVKEELVEDDS
jgi:hypothetical protein